MTWRRALAYVGIWLLLTITWAGLRRPASETGEPAPLARTPFGDLRPVDVVEIEIDSAGQILHATARGGRWEVSRPAGVTLGTDLIAALLEAVLDVKEIKTIRPDDPGHDEFGLAEPVARLTFWTADGAATRVLLGRMNPARTAIYGRREGSSDLVLVGLNVRYYLRMALQTASRDG